MTDTQLLELLESEPDLKCDPAGNVTLVIDRHTAEQALAKLRHFMGRNQTAAVRSGFRSEEAQFFYDKMAELADRIEAMPTTGKADGDDAIAYLRYFAGGQAEFFITERDIAAGNRLDSVNAEQNQAFGLADLFGDGGELGYISIQEIIENGGELDFHFTPKPLKEIRNE